VAARAIGALIGLEGSVNPLRGSATYRDLADLPLAARVERLAEPDIKTRILAELADRPGGMRQPFDRVFELGDPPDYEPQPEQSMAARATREGVSPESLMYDRLLDRAGTALLYFPVLNYFDGNLDAAAELLAHRYTVPGLGDGGAHVGTICDASFPTTLLTHWVRDRRRGARFELPWVIQQQCRATAETVGLYDRGVLAPGYKADVNVIDFDLLKLGPPEIRHDLPAGGKRLLQRATGYRHTIVSGVEVYCDGEPTGSLPGRLVRGAQKERA
jgi:N-acyl-D-aspartate/D-glutamate deacylase